MVYHLGIIDYFARPGVNLRMSFEGMALFNGLNAVERSRLLGKMDKCEFRHGSPIFAKGESGDGMYVIAKGAVEIYLEAPGGRKQTLSILGEGDTLGEMSLFTGEPRSAAASAIRDSILYRISPEVFEELVSEHTTVAAFFTRLLCDRLVRTNASLHETNGMRFDMVRSSLAHLSPELRRAIFFCAMTDGCSAEDLAAILESDSLPQKLQEAADAYPHLVERFGDSGYYRTPLSTKRVIAAVANVELSIEKREQFLVALVERFLESARVRDGVLLLKEHGRFEEACVTLASCYESRPAGEAPPFADAELPALLAACPDDILFTYYELLRRMISQLEPENAYPRLERAIEQHPHRFTARQFSELCEKMVEICTKLGYRHKAIAYMNLAVGGSYESGPLGLDRTALEGAMRGDDGDRAFAMAKLSYESAKRFSLVQSAVGLFKRNRLTPLLSGSAAAASVAAFSMMAPFDGLDRAGMTFIGITLAAVLLWIVNWMPDYLVSLLMCTSWALFGLAQPALALQGFSSELWLYIAAALAVGVAISKSGLMYRASLYVLKAFPKTYRGQLTGLVATGLTINPFIPSGLTKVILATPIAVSVADALGFGKHSRGSAGLVLTSFVFFSCFTPFFLTAGVNNFLAVGLVPQHSFGIAAWAWFALPPFLVLAATMLIVLMRMFPPEPISGRLSEQLVAEQLYMLGGMTRQEKTTLAVLVLVVALQALQPVHGIAGLWIMLLGMVMLVLGGVLDSRSLRSGIDFSSMLHLGVAISFSKVAADLGVIKWFSGILLGALGPVAADPWLLLPTLVAVIFASSFIIAGAPAVILFTVTLMPLADATGIHPWVIIFIVLLCSSPFFLSYQSQSYMAAYFTSDEKAFTHAQGRKLAWFFAGAVLLAVCASLPFWGMMGLLG